MIQYTKKMNNDNDDDKDDDNGKDEDVYIWLELWKSINIWYKCRLAAE